MRASIIIAAHQEGPLLGKTIESCLRSASDFEREIIVADDASSDGSVDDASVRFPEIKVVRHSERLGVSPTKDLGARRAAGDVLVFLDAHTNPEPGAVLRLVEDVELLEGAAVVTPAVARLCQRTWRNLNSSTGHGYSLELETFANGWLPLDKLRKVDRAGRTFYESPALMGCALAVARELYDRLWGFDPAMRLWGVEDLDFSLKCWLMGHAILHDPASVIGHRFQEAFSSYRVSKVQILASQMRMAYKNLSLSTWPEWLRMCRARYSDLRSEQPEGFFAAAWHQFELGRASAEHERVYHYARRAQDDLWYAERFGLPWPRLGVRASPTALPLTLHPFTDPSPTPTPAPCTLTGISPETANVCVGTDITFTAEGSGLDDVMWYTVPQGSPATGSGSSFTTSWNSPGANVQVYARCPGGVPMAAIVTVISVEFSPDPVRTGYLITPAPPYPCGPPPPQIAISVTAQVAPASAVEQVSLSVGGTDRIEIDNIQKDAGNGLITFTVTGTSATPAEKLNGDTTVQAIVGGGACAEVPVIVHVPYSIAPISADGVVGGVNQAADACSTPAYFSALAPDTVHLWTYDVQWLTIVVGDQFGNALPAFYQGAPVTEQGGLGINQFIGGIGSYRDPVGMVIDKSPGPVNVPEDGSDATDWVDGTDAVMAPPSVPFNQPQTIKVQVGGHAIAKGVVGRQVTVTYVSDTTARVQVIWNE